MNLNNDVIVRAYKIYEFSPQRKTQKRMFRVAEVDAGGISDSKKC